jgi:hypothetical protein
LPTLSQNVFESTYYSTTIVRTTAKYGIDGYAQSILKMDDGTAIIHLSMPTLGYQPVSQPQAPRSSPLQLDSVVVAGGPLDRAIAPHECIVSATNRPCADLLSKQKLQFLLTLQRRSQ